MRKVKLSRADREELAEKHNCHEKYVLMNENGIRNNAAILADIHYLHEQKENALTTVMSMRAAPKATNGAPKKVAKRKVNQ